MEKPAPSKPDLTAFLSAKKIDVAAFKAALPAEYEALEDAYAQMSPKSFDQQKKFVFNPIRLQFPLSK